MSPIGWGRPKPVPPPPPPGPVMVRVSVRRDGATVEMIGATLALDDGRQPRGAQIVDGRLAFTLPASTRFGWHATLIIDTADGAFVRSVTLAPDIDIDLPSFTVVLTLSRLAAAGRRLFYPGTQKLFPWQGLTAFRLVEMVAAGRTDEVDAYCAWASAHDVTILRVLTMAGSHNGDGIPYLFRLTPEDGRNALPRYLEIAARRGLYSEVVFCADTAFYGNENLQRHVTGCGRICAEFPGTVGQVANEPEHATQQGQFADPAYLAELRALVPRDVMTSFGPAHGTNDWDFKWAGGDIVTVHLDRSDGESEFTHDGPGLRWVRHIKDALDTSVALQKYVVNDECRRNDLTPWKHTAVAIICRMLGVGDTFHYGGGLQGKIPEGDELAAFEGRQRGWKAVPYDWEGHFLNVGHAGSPVPRADWSTVLKVFSAVNGDTAYTVAIGSDDPQFEWAPDWREHTVVLREGGVVLWRSTR